MILFPNRNLFKIIYSVILESFQSELVDFLNLSIKKKMKTFDFQNQNFNLQNAIPKLNHPTFKPSLKNSIAIH